MVIYLPLSSAKDWICGWLRRRSGKSKKSAVITDNSRAGTEESPLNYVAAQKMFEMDIQGPLNRKDSEFVLTDDDDDDEEEGRPLVSKGKEVTDSGIQEDKISTRQIAIYGCSLAPIWFITEVFFQNVVSFKFLSFLVFL